MYFVYLCLRNTKSCVRKNEENVQQKEELNLIQNRIIKEQEHFMNLNTNCIIINVLNRLFL